jgi:hypothetical protein
MALLGVIMLDTTFVRPPGDVGNPESWCSRCCLETESGVGVRTVACGDEGDLLDASITAETR